MILTDQFILRILTDAAELVVHVGDDALDIGHRHNGVLIQSELLVRQFLKRNLASREAVPYRSLRPFALGDVAYNLRSTQDRPAAVLNWRNRHRNVILRAILSDPDGFKMINALTPPDSRQNIGFLVRQLLRQKHQHRFAYGLGTRVP